jgi:hypothetical protein
MLAIQPGSWRTLFDPSRVCDLATVCSFTCYVDFLRNFVGAINAP